MNPISKFFRYWLPVLLWAGMIFYFSSIPSLESGFAVTTDWILRKGAHVFVYAVLTILVYRAQRGGHGQKQKTALWGAVVLALLYAGSDEFHQRFVDGRHGRLRDIGVDAVGIALAAWAVAAYGRKSKAQ